MPCFPQELKMVKKDNERRKKGKTVENNLLPENHIINGFSKDCKEVETDSGKKCPDDISTVPQPTPLTLQSNGVAHHGVAVNGVHKEKNIGNNNSGRVYSQQRKNNRRRSTSKGSDASHGSSASVLSSGRGPPISSERAKEVRIDVDCAPGTDDCITARENAVSAPADNTLAKEISALRIADSNPNADVVVHTDKNADIGDEEDEVTLEKEDLSTITKDSPATEEVQAPTPEEGIRLSDATTQSVSSCLSSVSDPLPSCSDRLHYPIEVECQTDSLHSDGLLAFVSLSKWDQLETMCQLVTCLDPFALRLLGTCVEGTARIHSSSLRNQEIRANKSDFIKNMLNSNQFSLMQAIETVFSMISLLYHHSRQEAYAFFDVIDRLYKQIPTEVASLQTTEEKLALVEQMGKLVSAALYHPAFNIDQRSTLDRMRSDLLQVKESLRIPVSKATRFRESSSSSHENCVFMTKLVADPNGFSGEHLAIEVYWSDGMKSFVGKTRDQLCTFHFRLLDQFGSEEFAHDGSRILPFLKIDCIDGSEFVAYVNRLSDLPARITLSPLFLDEFYVSRLMSADAANSFERPPPQMNADTCTTTKAASEASVLSSSAGGLMSPPPVPPVAPSYPLVVQNINGMHYLVQVPLRVVPYQPNVPSCSNCGGMHEFQECEKITFAEKNSADAFRLRVRSSDVTPPEEQSTASSNNGSSSGSVCFSSSANDTSSTPPTMVCMQNGRIPTSMQNGMSTMPGMSLMDNMPPGLCGVNGAPPMIPGQIPMMPPPIYPHMYQQRPPGPQHYGRRNDRHTYSSSANGGPPRGGDYSSMNKHRGSQS